MGVDRWREKEEAGNPGRTLWLRWVGLFPLQSRPPRPPRTRPEVINTTPSSLQPLPVTGRGAGVLRGWLRGLHGPLGQGQPPARCSPRRAWVCVVGSQTPRGGPRQVCVQGSSGPCRIHLSLPPPDAECLDLVAGGGGILLSPVFRRSRYILNKLKGIYMQVGFGPHQSSLHRE